MPYIFISKDMSLHHASGVIWYTHGRRGCRVPKSRMSLCVIRRYYNTSTVLMHTLPRLLEHVLLHLLFSVCIV